MAHFSHPINIDLQFDIDLLDSKGFLPKWPQVKLLFLEKNIHSLKVDLSFPISVSDINVYYPKLAF